MKKTLLIGLLISAIMVLSLTGCKNNAELDTGTSPKILGAFFASGNWSTSNDFDSVEQNYKITELNLNRASDRLVFKIEDPDKDFTEIQFSPDKNFDFFYNWKNMDYSTAEEEVWDYVRCGWNIEAKNKEKYIQFNQPIYVRAIDKNGNISKTFTIENITITNTPYSSPKILDAFFASGNWSTSTDFDSVEQNYKITELNLNRASDRLVFKIEDPDKDFTEIQFSPDKNFDFFYNWKNMDYSTAEEEVWDYVRCGWNIEAKNKEKYIQFNQPIYVRAIDKKGNISKTFTIENITITNTPYSGSAPELIEIFFTNANLNTNEAFKDWERLTTVKKSSSYALIIDFSDPDVDATELHLSFDTTNTEGTLFPFTQQYESQWAIWRDVKCSDFSDFSDFPTGNIKFSAYMLDKKGNKSNILTGELLIEE